MGIAFLFAGARIGRKTLLYYQTSVLLISVAVHIKLSTFSA